MSEDFLPENPVPPVFKVADIVSMLPGLAFPWLLTGTPPAGEYRTLLWLYPVYVILSGRCAWRCYPARPALAWILLALMWLSHAAIFYMCFAL